jgi:hypothetical protein
MWVLLVAPAVLPVVEETILLPGALHVGVKRLSKLVFINRFAIGRAVFILPGWDNS